MTQTRLRPMTDDDIDAVIQLAGATFNDLMQRLGKRPEDHPRTTLFQQVRHRHLNATDPESQWVAEDGDGTLAGAACALRREGFWGLSLLVVRPDAQDRGLGRRLLDQALESARGADGAIIISSSDPRAIRRYASAGFALWPTMGASGVVRRERLVDPVEVREGDANDFAHTESVDREVRGTPHGRDIPAMLEGGMRLAVSDLGYTVFGENRVVTVAARTREAATELLSAALIRLPQDSEVRVNWITGAQQWALEVVLAAGMDLRPEGPICTRGRLGPLTPYLPSGAYL